MKTTLSIKEDKFLINGKLIYREIPNNNPKVHGLLMNARFIQGIFDEKENRERYARFGFEKFDPMENTENLIKHLKEWYDYGLRAITVGIQGGGPCFTTQNNDIKNNPYSEDGKFIDKNYLERLKKIIIAADKIGMVVIVSFFYGAQTRWLKDDEVVKECVKTSSNWLKNLGYKNIIIEIANEQNLPEFKDHPILHTCEGVVELMNIARKESGELPVGCSLEGGYFSKKIAENSDVILIHANGCSRQVYYNLIKKAKNIKPIRPIVCNEDSQAISQVEVAVQTGTSWGYYNNMTKQEPPVYWGILDGEDRYFAVRMAEALGIEVPAPEKEFYIQGLEKHMTIDNKRWIRLASLYPEKINYVEFYRNGEYMDTAYDDPFLTKHIANWLQESTINISGIQNWEVKIYMHDGRVVLIKDNVKDEVLIQIDKKEKVPKKVC